MELETTLSIEKDDLTACPNIADLLSEADVKKIGVEAVLDYEKDRLSRHGWEKKMEEAMKLALQVVEAKSFPWVGASNVKFPLITIAALQYHARAYPNLINADVLVKYKIYGEDLTGEKRQKADRIESHMTYQILEEDEDWESEMDKVLITQPIIGCAFKKSYFDPIKHCNISENILARDLVVNYWAKSLATAPRITHVLYFQKNDVYERVVRGLWCEMNEVTPAAIVQSNMGINANRAQGTYQPESVDSSTPYEILEQHRYLDLDNDGYAEPYIVFVRKDTKQVMRIVARYTSDNVIRNKSGEILNIFPENYFTKYPFIPSPDGGFYDLGFGSLLGPLNASIDTAINQMIDAGTMATTAGGFLSKGVRIRGGNYSFSPLEWKHVESTGDDLRKGIFPLPVREPSPVLYQLLGLLINYGERIGMSVDIMVGGNPGQNTPAETSRTMVEQGSKIFNGIFKRTYRSFREELRHLYRLNQLHLDDEVKYEENKIARWDDYTGDVQDICPAADPNIVSDQQRMMQAEAVRAVAITSPGFNMYQVNKNYLQALKIPNIDMLLPDPTGPNAIPPGKDIKLQIAEMQAQVDTDKHTKDFQLGMLELMQEVDLIEAKIGALQAQAEESKAKASSEANYAALGMINAQISLEKNHKETLHKSLDIMTKMYAATQKAKEKTVSAK